MPNTRSGDLSTPAIYINNICTPAKRSLFNRVQVCVANSLGMTQHENKTAPSVKVLPFPPEVKLGHHVQPLDMSHRYHRIHLSSVSALKLFITNGRFLSGGLVWHRPQLSGGPGSAPWYWTREVLHFVCSGAVLRFMWTRMHVVLKSSLVLEVTCA